MHSLGNACRFAPLIKNFVITEEMKEILCAHSAVISTNLPIQAYARMKPYNNESDVK